MSEQSSFSRAAALAALAIIASACGTTHHRWRNYLHDHEVHGTHFRPRSATELLERVEVTTDNGGHIRAVGSGHSSSEVAQPFEESTYVDLDYLDQVQDWPYYARPEQPVSDDDPTVPRERYVRVGAGATIQQINRFVRRLDPRRALFNMGNYDAQTIAGAFSTATHGSGLDHGPLTDRILAIELITDEHIPDANAAGGFRRVRRLLRIEPENGITDRARFEAEHAEHADGDIQLMQLEQRDDVFDAVLVNLGCFGIIVSVTVDTRPAFYLRESETLHRWAENAPPDLEALANTHREFLQLTVVPHRILDDGGSHVGEIIYVETVRTAQPYVDGHAPLRPPNRETLGRTLAVLGSTGLLENIQLDDPWRGLRAVTTTFEERVLADDFVSRSDRVLINSLAPEVDATSIDIWVPLDRAAAAIGRVLEIAEERGTYLPGPVWEEWWHTSPLGIRFVGRSRALLAPSHDQDRVSIEIPLLYDLSEPRRERALHNIYRNRMMKTLEHELTQPELGGRPHWGQRNWMNAARAVEMYGDDWDCWVEQYRRFNHYGTFDNPFTDRMCLSDADDPSCADAPPAGVCGDGLPAVGASATPEGASTASGPTAPAPQDVPAPDVATPDPGEGESVEEGSQVDATEGEEG